MIKVFALAFILLNLSEAANPGVSVAISKNGLQYAGDQAMRILTKRIKQIKIPDVYGDKYSVYYSLSNMKITKVGKPRINIGLIAERGLSIWVKGGLIELKGRWSASKFFLKSSGTFTAKTESIDFKIDGFVEANGGKPKILPRSCNGHLKNFKIEIGGSWLSYVYEFIISFFNGKIKKAIEKEICSKLFSVLKSDANHELSTLNLIANIGNKVKLDYHLVRDPEVTSTHLIFHHEGKFVNDPGMPHNMGFLSGRMASTSISADTLNSLARFLHKKKLIDFRIPIMNEASVSIMNSTFGINDKIVAHVASSKPPTVKIDKGKLYVQVETIIKIYTEKLLLEIDLKLATHSTIRLEQNRLKGTFSDPSLEVDIRKNYTNFPLFKALINNIANESIKKIPPLVNEKLNEGLPLPTLQHVSLHNFKVNLVPGHIQVAYDVTAK